MKKPLSKKAKGLLITAVLLVVMGIAFGVIGKYAKSLVTEGTYTPERTYENETELGSGAYSAMCNIFDSAVHTDKIGTSLSVDLSIDDASIETDLDQSTLGVLKYMKGSILSSIRECYPSGDGAFKKPGEVPRAPRFHNTDLSPYCTSTVGRDDNGETVETDKIFFTVSTPFSGVLPTKNDEMYDVLNIDASLAASEKIKKEYADVVDFTDIGATLKSFEITGTFKRAGKTPVDCRMTAVYTVTAKLSFKGEYASLGKKSIKFDYTVKENYGFRFAGVEITDGAAWLTKKECPSLASLVDRANQLPVIFIEQGEEKALPVSFNVNDGEECSAKFIVHDKDRVSVSDEGVVTGLKASPEPNVIDIELEYLGSTHKADVVVFVVEPVKKVLTSPAAVTLATGETSTLTCEVTPAEASVKDVIWLTEDESIATVDENGAVTAVGAGTVKVFAVTVNGNFRSSCTVTVSEKEAK